MRPSLCGGTKGTLNGSARIARKEGGTTRRAEQRCAVDYVDGISYWCEGEWRDGFLSRRPGRDAIINLAAVRDPCAKETLL